MEKKYQMKFRLTAKVCLFLIILLSIYVAIVNADVLPRIVGIMLAAILTIILKNFNLINIENLNINIFRGRGKEMHPVLDFELIPNVVPRSGLKRYFVIINIENPKDVERAFFLQFINDEKDIEPIVCKELLDLSEPRSGGYYLGLFDESVKEMNYYVEWIPVAGGKYFSYLHITKNDNGTWWPQREKDRIYNKRKKYLKKIYPKLYDYLKKNKWK